MVKFSTRIFYRVFQGVVSITFHELFKIISPKYTMPEITVMVIISNWIFVCVPKAWHLGTHTKFQLEILIRSTISAIHKLKRIFWRARETLLNHPPGFGADCPWGVWCCGLTTCPLYHGVQARMIARSRKNAEFKLAIVRRIFTRLYNVLLQNMVLGNCHLWFTCMKAAIHCKNYRHI